MNTSVLFKENVFKAELKGDFWVFSRYKNQLTIEQKKPNQNTDPQMKNITNSL